MEFLGKSVEYEDAKAVVFPIGDCGEVMSASKELETFDEETNKSPVNYGIYTAQNFVFNCENEALIKQIEQRANEYLNDNKFVISISDKEVITLGLIKTLKQTYDDFSVLHIDAMPDLRENVEGDKYNNVCVMKRVSELGVPLVQVGIRTISKEENFELSRINTKIFYMHNIINNEFWMDGVMESLKKKVYLSIDLRVLDPSIMQNNKLPGGFTWWQLMQLLRYTFKAKNVIGAEVVGLGDNNFLVAKLIYKLIGYKFDEANKRF